MGVETSNDFFRCLTAKFEYNVVMVQLATFAKALLSAFFLGIACLPSGWCCTLTPCKVGVGSANAKATTSPVVPHSCCKPASSEQKSPAAPASPNPCKSCKCQPAISVGLPLDNSPISVDFPVIVFSLDITPLAFNGFKSSSLATFTVVSSTGLQFLQERCRWNC